MIFFLKKPFKTGGTSARLLLHNASMEALSQMLPRMEEVDLSGQTEVGPEGWTSLCNGLRICNDRRGGVNLR